jgi:predicted Zn finger-like uncharacterized protein
VAGVTQAHLAAMADEAGQVRVACKHCDAPMVIDDAQLASEVTCKTCEQSFVADWGEPVMAVPDVKEAPEGAADTA